MARSPNSVFDLPDVLYEDASGPSWRKWANELDPTGDRYTASQSMYPEDLFSWGANLHNQTQFDPQPKGEMWGTVSTAMGHNTITGSINKWLQDQYPDMFNAPSAGGLTNPGAIGTLGGDEWGNVDKWNQQILGAIRAVQSEPGIGVYVPANVVKAIMKIESNGDPAAGPAYGLMQLTGNAMAPYSADQLMRMRTDPGYGIYAGVKDLALRYLDAQRIDPKYGWGNAAVGFFSGHYEPTGANDAAAGGPGTTDNQYLQAFNNYYDQLSSGSAAGGAAAPGTSQLSAVWGGFDAPITQEFGHTDFADNSEYAKEAYGYTADYTRDQQPVGHAGIDVGVARNTPLYAPQGGTVRIVGANEGGDYYYCDRDVNGCGAGRGELAIEYPNHDILILGHMADIRVKVGQQLQPGQFVGYSGSENGAHVHVEYRRWVGDGVTNTGWEVIDPNLAIQGVFSGSYGQAGTGAQTAAAATGDWNDFMTAAAQGQLLTGSLPASDNWHNWLLQNMGIQPKPITGFDTSGPIIWGDADFQDPFEH